VDHIDDTAPIRHRRILIGLPREAYAALTGEATQDPETTDVPDAAEDAEKTDSRWTRE
jgi:hypothetical protein